MKSKIILLTTAIITILFIGCSNQPATISKTAPQKTTTTIVNTAPKVSPKKVTPTVKIDSKSNVTKKHKLISPQKVTSIVSTSAQFENAISNKGTCIIVIIRNITINKNLVVNGDYTNGKNILERKIDLYRRNKDKNMTGRLNLAVTKLTVNSPRTSIEHGTFKGNIYVSSNNFRLIDAKVEGNVYFTTNEAKSTFKMVIKG